MATPIEETVVEELQEAELDVLEVEEQAVIVKVDGWRMRIYFEENYEYTQGRKVLAKFYGDINDAHTVRFEKLK
jgi:hypothetical protein